MVEIKFKNSPEWIVNVEPVVVTVVTNIFSEVGNFVVFSIVVFVVVVVFVVSGVVGIYNIFEVLVMFTFELVLVTLLEHINVEVVEWIHLIWCWQNDTLQLNLVCYQSRYHIDEHVLVHIVTCPDDVLVKSIPVLALVEEVKQVFGGQEVVLTKNGEWCTTLWEEIQCVEVLEELLHDSVVLSGGG